MVLFPPRAYFLLLGRARAGGRPLNCEAERLDRPRSSSLGRRRPSPSSRRAKGEDGALAPHRGGHRVRSDVLFSADRRVLESRRDRGGLNGTNVRANRGCALYTLP